MSVNELYNSIKACQKNYDYTSYYDDNVFYNLSKHLKHLSVGDNNLVYSSKEDCIYSWLDLLKIRNAIID